LCAKGGRGMNTIDNLFNLNFILTSAKMQLKILQENGSLNDKLILAIGEVHQLALNEKNELLEVKE
jgi:hypothetical protein